MKSIIDGNKACSKVAYLMSEICSIYPITPSSPMASEIDNLITKNKKNLFNQPVKLIEMQSEAGAAGTMHGALITGSLASTFTASQGLLLMIPNMYKIAGECLPGVIHVASRSLATHALSIFGDHQDIYATRQTGFCMLASNNVEEANHLAAVAHLSAIEGSLPFLHFFDGFRTSHEVNTVDLLKDEDILKLIPYEKIDEFKCKTLNDDNKIQKGLAENDDIYFQSTEARNSDYLKIPNIVNNYMTKINEIMNTDYKPFNYYGDEFATEIIIAMGSVIDTIKLTVDKLNQEGHHVGVISVHLYRPFSKEYLLNVLPETVKNIAVLDRTKEAGSVGEPLYLDVLSVLKDKDINICGGRYGLSSRNTTPDNIAAVYKMLETSLKNEFTIGIIDDVTNLSLPDIAINVELKCDEIKIYGFGSDGMVSASKDILKIIHKEKNKFVQGYYEYDSKKSGGITISHLRISEGKINAPYYVEKPNIIVVTKDEYFSKFKMLSGIKENGILLVNTNKDLNDLLTNEDKNLLIEKKIRVFTIDAEALASEAGIRGKINKIIETILLKLLNVDNSLELIINSIKETLKNKGEEIVQNNINAVTKALDSLNEFSEFTNHNTIFEKVNEDVIYKINHHEGYTLTVSELQKFKEGSFPCSLTRLEKRGVSGIVPDWNSDKCIECGQCSLVCPHAVIRPIADKNDELKKEFIGNSEYRFQVVISEEDCTGCGLCVNNCPTKALSFKEKDNSNDELVKKYFGDYENPELVNPFTVKGSQLRKPCFEFSGACAGCGETPYLKLLTQLYQDKLIIANATGCSSIYGGSAPSTPYSISWANSLFEDNAEFALGMHLSNEAKKGEIRNIIETSINSVSADVKELFNKWLENQNDYKITKEVSKKLENLEIPMNLKKLLPYMPSKTVWAVGGDGWAYDIGFGGLDHLLSSNENVKVLVLDTEVYSNTGGQASKSSNIGQVAEFANFGKKTYKKDLFKIAMSYPNCYVASISLGANYFHTIKVMKEAEEHNGPAIIIAYSPCVEQGINGGMINSIKEEKLAVECGYTALMRYNPNEDKLYLDSKEPDFTKYIDFLQNERRYKTLMEKDEALANELLNNQIENAKKRYEYYKNLTK